MKDLERLLRTPLEKRGLEADLENSRYAAAAE